MNTDFETFASDVDALDFMETLLREATQFSVALLPETGEWVVSWPVKARVCPDQRKAEEEDMEVWDDEQGA